MAMSRCLGGMSLTIWSPIHTSPSVGSSRPAIIRSNVDFPHPEGPSSTMNSRSPMSRTTLSTAVTSPNRLDTLLSRTPATGGHGRRQLATARARVARGPRCAPRGDRSPTLVVVPSDTDHPIDAPTDGAVDGPELARAIEQIAQDLAGVELALVRLDAGTYWTCEVTGEPLPDELLAADPVARRRPEPEPTRLPDPAAPPPPLPTPSW